MNCDAHLEPQPLVDLRSDTVTHPTPAMYERMRMAALGDDGLEGDPTVRQLEALVARKLGKEAGLFVPTATMANLLATLSQAQRQEQVLMEATAHMYTSERDGATLAGVFYAGVRGRNGAMELNELEDALRPAASPRRASLVCMETSHNNAGGTVLSLEHMAQVYAAARRAGARVHLDGARLFNAAVALQVEAAAITSFADTVSLCLCKGLSAPVGAILAGPGSTIDKARGWRKVLGGTQRQAGIVAAAGIVAIEEMAPRLVEDHLRASHLSRALAADMLPLLSTNVPQTNIVLVDLPAGASDSAAWVDALQRAGVLVRPWGRYRLRCVTHRHVDDRALERVLAAFRTVADRFLSSAGAAINPSALESQISR